MAYKQINLNLNINRIYINQLKLLLNQIYDWKVCLNDKKMSFFKAINYYKNNQKFCKTILKNPKIWKIQKIF